MRYSFLFVFSVFIFSVGEKVEASTNKAREMINEAQERYYQLCASKSNEECYALMLDLSISGNKADEELLSRHLCLNVIDVKRNACLRFVYQANKHKQAIQEESCKLGNEKGCALSLLIQQGSAANKKKNISKLANYCREKRWAFACTSSGISMSGKNKKEAIELFKIGCEIGDDKSCEFGDLLK